MVPGNYTRFNQPSQGEQVQSEYDFDSSLIADALARGIAPFVVTTLDLSVAGSRTLNIPGRGFVAYYFQTNTVNDARASSGLITIAINNDGSEKSQLWQAKYNRGFRGSFSTLNLNWLAQSNTSARFIIFKSNQTPWMTDDSDTAAGGGVSSIATTTPLATTGGSTPTLSITNTSVAGQFLAGPVGAGGVVTERLISISDIPILNQSTTGNANTATSVSGTNVITNANLSQAPALSLKGNNTGALANENDLTVAQVNSMLADITSLTGDVVATGSGGAASATIQTNVVSNTKLAQMPANTLKGNNTAGVANAADLTAVQARALISSLPNYQQFLTGSGTYTVPANALYLRVRMVGGGGGGAGAGSSPSSGTAGTASTFGTTLLNAGAGSFGVGTGANGGAGGTASLGTGPVGIALSGSAGTGGSFNNASSSNQAMGGGGGSTPFGGAGGGGGFGTTPTAAVSNTGSGGGGGGGVAVTNEYTGAGGGAGGFIDCLITTLLSTYSYAIGAAGTGGAGGAAAGGAGATGFIEVIAYFQ